MSAPVSVDLTAAAEEFLRWAEDVDGQTAAYSVWMALVSVYDDDEALALARSIAAASPPINAHVPPM